MKHPVAAVALAALTLTAQAQTPAQVEQFKRQLGLAESRLTDYSEGVAQAMLTEKRSVVVARVKRGVSRRMKDPDSVKFRDIVLRPYAKGHVLCGQVNAKNSYGAYAGFSQFVAGIDVAAIHTGTGDAMDDFAETMVMVGCR